MYSLVRMDRVNAAELPKQRPTGIKPASLKDIAARAGVSYSLVSKVLRDKMGNAGVRPEVRDKILKLAAEMHYRPHSLASDLKKGRKGAIGVLLHPFGERGSGLVESFLQGLATGLDQRGLRMWMTFFEFDEELVEHLSMRMRHDIDGLIVAGVPHPSTYALIKELHASGLPVVTMFEETVIEGIPNVSQDRRSQGYLPARHLLEQGCRRIVHLDYSGASARYQGIADAHREAGVELLPELRYQFENFRSSEGEVAVEHLLDQGLAFDGIITQSDQQAWGAILALQRHGLRVPDDVRVTGMDDSVLSEISPVKITSVTAEMKTVSQHMVEILSALLEGSTPESVRLPVRLVQRDSA